jgi:hypothetical protein
MKRICMFATAVTLCGLCTGLTVSGQEKTDKKGPNVQDAPKGVKESDKTKALENLELANRLIQYGRAHKNAESLLVAAQILHDTPTEKLTVGHKVTGEKNEKVAPPVKMINSPKALVAEAKKLSSSPAIEALAMATLKVLEENPRGALGGPRTDAFTIQPLQTINWNPITFVGGQPGVVHIANGQFGAMILEVRDEFGNLVARDNVPGTFFRCSWTPAFTGPFTIRLINIDTISFRCAMATN